LLGTKAAIDRWLSTSITKQQVKQHELPLSDDYFTNNLGEIVSRTQFEYIRDHLGYRLELQQARFPDEITSGQQLQVDIQLINRGLAIPYNPRSVYVTLVDLDGNVTAFKTEANPRHWQPYKPGKPLYEGYEPLVHRIALKRKLPADLEPGIYRVGLWLPDQATKLRLRPEYAIRVANRYTPFWTNTDGEYGINLIGELRVTQ
jgi:hypothetical protein